MQVARLISALHAETRGENFAKTSTWWAQKKAGKGTQHSAECQAYGAHLISFGKLAFLWITLEGSV